MSFHSMPMHEGRHARLTHGSRGTPTLKLLLHVGIQEKEHIPTNTQTLDLTYFVERDDLVLVSQARKFPLLLGDPEDRGRSRRNTQCVDGARRRPCGRRCRQCEKQHGLKAGPSVEGFHGDGSVDVYMWSVGLASNAI